MKKQLSFKAKLISAFLLIGLIPLLIIAIISFINSSNSLKDMAQNNLTSSREGIANQIEGLFKSFESEIRSTANNKTTIEAVDRFNNAFIHFKDETDTSFSTSKETLTAFYENEFIKQYNKLNIDPNIVSVQDNLSKFSENAIHLQNAFISSNPNALGEKDKQHELDDDSAYGRVHKAYHSTFQKILYEFSYYDIFIVDSKSGDIVYSVFKEIDFATNLKTGPFANSGIGQAFKKANESEDFQKTHITDLAKYYPSYDAPASFISIPIVKESKKIGVLIFQIPVDRINKIMTLDGKWSQSGLGRTGEAYLIGKDKKMRSVSRKLVEKPDEYLKLLKETNISQKDFNYIKAKQTNAIVTSIKSEGANKVTSGKTGFSVYKNPKTGENVFSAFRPLKINGLDWAILSEIEESEALEPVGALRILMAITIAIFMAIIAGLSYLIASSLFKSLMSIANNVKREAEKVSESSHHLDKDSKELSQATTEQVSSLTQTSASINEISAMVDRNTATAENVSNMSTQSKDKANEGQNAIIQVRQAIDEIYENNSKLSNFVDKNNDELTQIISVIESIGDKTQIINDIVFQTRLLSFNASVEAARAGDHGKGFAVVAEEIGGLANMSGTAATEITELLTESSEKVKSIVNSSKTQMNEILETGKSKVDHGLTITDRSKELLAEIVENFSSVNKGISDIASSAIEQSQGVQEINSAISLLDSTTHKNSQIAKNSSQNAEELKGTASELEESIESLQLLLNGKA